MNLFTLRKMAAGGMHDHLGGGFHRYSVDRYWHVPHFEKMLYDQAQLAVAYLDAFQITQDRQFEAVARDILDYVARDMTAKEGGFFSAEDADSLIASRANPRHAEGAFYVWTKKEVDARSGDAAEMFDLHYGVRDQRQLARRQRSARRVTGKNILIERHTIAETAKQFKKTEDEVRAIARAKRARSYCRSARKRPRPHLDDKIISAWNGLMISAYARAAQVFNEPRYLESATHAAQDSAHASV